MLCQRPFTRGMAAYPCGQCMPCRFNRRRIWTHRIMLESLLHGDNCFATLTYENGSLPLLPGTLGIATLVPSDIQNWLKRLRKAIEPLRIRYYLVGEYGDESWRPHYHVALFGYPGCAYGVSRYRAPWRKQNCCESCDRVRDTWGKGFVELGQLEIKSAQYVAGYVAKKMTSKDDPRLEGRYPEFARMSLRPGIGYDAMHEVASTLLSLNLDQSQPDVPSGLRHAAQVMPLGRYLRRKLRLMSGKEESAPQETLDEVKKEMLPLLEAARSDPENPSLRSQIIKRYAQEVLNQKTRTHIYRGRKVL